MKRTTYSMQDCADNLLIKKSTTEDTIKLAQHASSETDNHNGRFGSKTTLNLRLGKCEVCAAKEALYTCPKCEVKTCCLDCVRIHKKELDCNGIRDRSKFIPLKKMTKMDFMSDYYFLEECTRYVNDRKGDQIKTYTNCRHLPLQLTRLRKAAEKRHINLKFLLQNFVRHKENTTYFDWHKERLWWRIKWIFINAGNLCYTDERCLESEYLRDLLKKYVGMDVTEDQVPQKRKLEYYQSKGVQNLKVLLKAEGIKRSKNRFYLLDVNKTLTANLAGKTIVEYPWIYVSYDDDCNAFDIIDSDEDVEYETKMYKENLEACHKELLKKQENIEYADDAIDVVKDEQHKTASNKRKQERKRKRQEYENCTNNYLFTDEHLMEILSSSSDDEEARIIN